MNYKFSCGCEVPQIDSDIDPDTGLPGIVIPYDKIISDANYGKICKPTMQMFRYGQTKGIFQLEQTLGRTWSRKVVPDTLSEIADLISIIRPGSLMAMIGNKNMSQLYVDRRNGTEEVRYLHDSLEPYLKDTYGVMCYQEQQIRIARGIAGFTPQEADQLRKSVGKKDAQLMNKVGRQFIEGCEKTGIVNNEQAEEIFGWIKASSRYLFNACLVPTGIVQTIDGEFKTLDEIQIGEKILSDVSGHTTVLNKYESGVKYVHSVTLWSADKPEGIFGYYPVSKTIECTLDHEFMCEDGNKHTLEYIYKNQLRIRTVTPHSLSYNSVTSTSKIEYRTVYCQIQKIEPLYYHRVIDIEVDNESHTFLCNGIETSNSHATGYAMLAYLCAWVKHHLPLHFFASWIGMAHHKQKAKDELRELVYEAKEFNIDVMPPSILDTRDPWVTIDDHRIRLGLQNTSSVGASHVHKIRETIQSAEDTLNKKITDFTWLEMLMFVLDELSEPVVVNLISVGGVPSKISRVAQLHEYKCLCELTAREKDWMRNMFGQYASLAEAIALGIESTGKSRCFFNKNRVQNATSILSILKNPPMSTNDSVRSIVNSEETILGVGISATRLDSPDRPAYDTTCAELKSGKESRSMRLVVEILAQKEYIIKKGLHEGRPMGYLTVGDETGSVEDVTVFPDVYESCVGELYTGNVIVLDCYVKNGVIARNIHGI